MFWFFFFALFQAVVPLHSLYTLSCEVSSENYQLKVDLAAANDKLNHANSVVNQLALELQKTHIQHFKDGFHHFQVMGSRMYPKINFGQIPFEDGSV